jgi:DNA-binding MarR family transcriptional regulator
MSFQIISGLGLKVRKLSNFIASYDKTAMQRVAEYLITNNTNTIKHKDIAERLNMRPETFSRTIAKLIQKGAIIDNVVNRDELYKLL